MNKKHPGFKDAVRQIEQKEGYSENVANKIIGAGKAHASEQARKSNPRLNRTGGKGK